MYFDSTAYEFWMFLGNDCGLGLGMGLVGATIFSKLIFAPTVLYQVSVSLLINFAANDGHQNEAASARHGQSYSKHQEALVTGQLRSF